MVKWRSDRESGGERGKDPQRGKIHREDVARRREEGEGEGGSGVASSRVMWARVARDGLAPFEAVVHIRVMTTPSAKSKCDAVECGSTAVEATLYIHSGFAVGFTDSALPK